MVLNTITFLKTAFFCTSKTASLSAFISSSFTLSLIHLRLDLFPYPFFLFTSDVTVLNAKSGGLSAFVIFPFSVFGTVSLIHSLGFFALNCPHSFFPLLELYPLWILHCHFSSELRLWVASRCFLLFILCHSDGVPSRWCGHSPPI